MQQNHNKSAMLNGLTIGGLLSLKFIFLSSKVALLSLFSNIISIYIIFALFKMTKSFIRNEESPLNFFQKFTYTFRTYLYGGLLSSLVILIYTKFITPQFIEEIKNETYKVYNELNIQVSSSQIDIIEYIHSRPEIYTFTNIFTYVLTGAFWGFIVALSLKKMKENTTQNN